MNIDINKKSDYTRKYKEYEMKITKMAGFLADHYIDDAIDVNDFSQISSFLIDYFSGSAGIPFDIGYLISKYKEFGLDEKVEDIDFDVNEWYKIKYELDHTPIIYVESEDKENEFTGNMTDEEYVKYMVEKRKPE